MKETLQGRKSPPFIRSYPRFFPSPLQKRARRMFTQKEANSCPNMLYIDDRLD